MSQNHANDAIDSYFEIERRFNHFLTAVTFKSEHLKVHSPLLAGILLDTGSLVESMLKSAMDNPRYDNTADIAAIRARRYVAAPPYYNVNDSRTVFRPDQFYAKKVWFLSRSDSSFPWHAWMNAAGPHPKWWQSYNHVKHDRFGNMAEAKLGTIMHAMEATFLVLVQTLDFRDTLVSRGMIRSSTLNTQELRAAAIAWEPLHTPAVVVAVSSLFGYKYISHGSRRQAVDVSVFL